MSEHSTEPPVPGLARRGADGAGAPATITAYVDGPYIVRGEFELRDQHGAVIETRRRAIALCRCGKSRIRPYCDGTHRLVGFRAPGGAETCAPVPAVPE